MLRLCIAYYLTYYYNCFPICKLTALFKPTVSLHSAQKYLESHRSQLSNVRTFFIKDVLNISDTSMATKKYSSLCINVFVIIIYGMG